MKSLFDRFIPATTPFQPKTTTELFALRLSQKLEDAAAVRHYVTLSPTITRKVNCLVRTGG